MQQEQAKAATIAASAASPSSSSADSSGGGRRWPTPAVMKALLASYEMTVHRFPTFLRCLEGGGGMDGDGEGVVGRGGKARAAGGVEGWETSRMNFGTSGWRLLGDAGGAGAGAAEGKKQK